MTSILPQPSSGVSGPDITQMRRSMWRLGGKAALAVFLCLALTQPALAQNTWGNGQKLTLETFDCPANARDLLIKGQVELIHPKDTGGSNAIPEILIKCDRIVFEAGSKVIVKANLYIRAETAIQGEVDIENRRATDGANGDRPASMDDVIRQADGTAGAAGGKGDSAQVTSTKYPFGRNADNGGQGGAGGRGTDGVTGADGTDGRDGTNAGAITLKSRSFKGVNITLSTRGGNGGKGAKGGRGQDGGHGGAGGAGGEGGDGDTGRTAGNGGNGGKGGDGGHGARGGRGGDGGNGGAGGNQSVLLIVDDPNVLGIPPNDVIWRLEGGAGGEPGLGGDGGHGGRGAAGGRGGCGGAGKGIIWKHPDGSCGEPGPRGVDGRDGDPGLSGKWGKDGPPGQKGTWKMGFVLETGGH
jgi:hypothetical protein